MDLVFDVFPIESQSKIASSFPIGVEFIIFLEYCEKMFDILFVDLLYSKVVNNKGEADWMPIVVPVAGCDCALVISCDE